jgi:hypothetical protein
MLVDPDLNLEVGYFFLSAGPGGFAGVGDLFRRPL